VCRAVCFNGFGSAQKRRFLSLFDGFILASLRRLSQADGATGRRFDTMILFSGTSRFFLAIRACVAYNKTNILFVLPI
jgi:hypothetical protein